MIVRIVTDRRKAAKEVMKRKRLRKKERDRVRKSQINKHTQTDTDKRHKYRHTERIDIEREGNTNFYRQIGSTPNTDKDI